MTTVGSTFSRRDEGEQMRLSAGIAGGMEDALASSLSASFKIPAHTSKPKTDGPLPNAASDPSAPAPHATQEEPIPGMDEWKSTYDSYLSSWQAESHEAREKAKKNRENIEKENQEKLDKELNRRKEEDRARKAESKKKEDEDKLKMELEGEVLNGRVEGKGGKKGAAVKTEDDRDAKIKEAWELVGKGTEDAREVEVDGRGVMAEDEASGQAAPAGQDRPHIKQTAYDPTTSTEPLPPFMQDEPKPQTFSLPSEKATQSRQSATSHAWEQVSAPSNTSTPQSSPEDLSPSDSVSGLSGEEMMSVPRVNNAERRSTGPALIAAEKVTAVSNQDSKKDSSPSDLPTQPSPLAQPPAQSLNTPPAQPPSLTLSLFTDYSRLSLSRVVAVVGINLVLPFINGIMLGFGEIFAREAVQVGRTWWRQSGSWFGISRRANAGWRDVVKGGSVDGGGEGRDRTIESFDAARGVTGVGLSGSGGFP